MMATGLRYAARTHVGKVRRLNEDSILTLPDIGVFTVADGMGGHAGGDFASQTITECIATISPDMRGLDLLQAVRAAILVSHDLIAEEAQSRGGATMGSTVVALIVAGGYFACLWAGDSRLYLCRDGDVELLTHDHSLVGEMVRNGQLSWREAEKHPQANVITRAIGVGRSVEVDKVRGETHSGDRFLLCSDGISRYMDPEDIAGLLVSRSIETVADALIERALEAGGEDNASVIVVEVT